MKSDNFLNVIYLPIEMKGTTTGINPEAVIDIVPANLA